MAKVTLSQFKSNELFINRELSWLEFNNRVLDEAENHEHPLMERLKFLIIFDSNLDEFFMVRVAGLKDQLENDIFELSSDGLTARQQLVEIRKRVNELYERHAKILTSQILPEMEKNDIVIHQYETLSQRERDRLKEYFFDDVLPILTPLALDTAHPFPRLLNRSLNIVYVLKGADNTQTPRTAVLQLPPVLPRFVRLKRSSGYHFVLLEEIIQANSQVLFSGFEIEGSYAFRVTRDAELEIAEDEAGDLVTELQEQIRQRPWGAAPVRLEVMSDMPVHLVTMLQTSTGLETDDVYIVKRTLNFPEFFALMGLEIPELKDPQLSSRKIPEFLGSDDEVFEAIAKKDVVVHHPFDSFSNSLIRFLNAAVTDPKVLAIKITLYRAGKNSPVVEALKKAVENGKQVTAFVELKARFDEENNIQWARELEQAGAHVVYGVVGLKTHCKMTMVVRSEGRKMRTYVHLSTGNYNLSTSRIYTDIGLFSAREDFAEDVIHVFNMLTGYSNHSKWEQFSVAPKTLKSDLLKLINREIENHSEAHPGLIFAKMNALVDEDIIRMLYKASQKGVKIQLLIRGICCLRPGVKDLSENIEVRSILGRFLEHSRIFYFGNGNEPEIYLSSADWMPRNFIRRVEIMFPIVDKEAFENVRSILDLYWKDNNRSRALLSSGKYVKLERKEGEHTFNAQHYLLEAHSGRKNHK